ncbi:glutamate--cysteine ligase [Rhodoferax antarcticus]|uniref:Glutamate--cysteine ligase n=1 Tax=Rhodoferax antarcticus ANT.BR TaxID=1111071 RepID=A0A1Q8YGL9_9BURK|nr:glutamate--cysteine ligase [Rhodoferax antarcticus]APW45335.1 glutamate--cysteine ligase [Rhodoferax antarcticus]OLP07211.1 glutamate--cysteine ligase [Rhodoferax antarcticus ANT.BR]
MLKFTCCNQVRQFSEAEQAQVLRGIQRGYERECLRVDRSGQMAHSSHPSALGAKLTHPWITTDYAEALLEFITPPSTDPAYPLAFLQDIHRFSAQQLSGEFLWAGSMPCRIGPDADIAIANYGSSNAARFKQVYREGLGLRYGRAMQTIAGAHYNWSLPDAFWPLLHDCCNSQENLPDFINRRYFGLIRNFLRYGWLVPYLFGASPAVCKSFLQDHPSDLTELAPGTLHGPFATSLRMSDLGYQNHAQDKLAISFNTLADYAQGLEAAIRTPDPYYAEMGVREGDTWKQLSDCLLQLEAEFYAPMRPKRVGLGGERPALALKTYGVQYVEMRLFDLNPFVDIGITPEQSLFADALLLMCLFRDSPPITSREQGENDENKHRVVTRGRQPDLQLLVHNREQPLRALAHELFDDMAPFAAMLDTAYGGQRCHQALLTLRQRIDQPELTPSAQVIEAVKQHGGYFNFAFEMSKTHTQSLQAVALTEATNATFKASVQRSLEEQAKIDATPEGLFEDFVAAYYA